MGMLCIDAHAHLYDCYDLNIWCQSAVAHLGDGGCLVAVDRIGQDSCARLLRQSASFVSVESLVNGLGVVVTLPTKEQLLVLRGVQYVAEEKIEVLGFGVGRTCDDDLPAQELIEGITRAGGVPCLPWSPGKWLGKRGVVVRAILEAAIPGSLTVGDIAIRSWAGPPSLLLKYAVQRGFSIVCGTDPLPRSNDQALVGEFGMAINGNIPEDIHQRAQSILQHLATGKGCRVHGTRNGPIRALKRFLVR